MCILWLVINMHYEVQFMRANGYYLRNDIKFIKIIHYACHRSTQPSARVTVTHKTYAKTSLVAGLLCRACPSPGLGLTE